MCLRDRINVADSGHTIKLQHGAGQGYYYDIDGDFSLEDLDGNTIVKGSAGSVGQGGSEILDELLSYKSLNIRKSLTRYKSTKDKTVDNNGWGEANFSTLKRKQNNQNLSLGLNSADLSINLPNSIKLFLCLSPVPEELTGNNYSNLIDEMYNEIDSNIEQDIQRQLDKEAEITKSGLESMRQAGGNTTVVNNTNVSNTANTSPSSIVIPKSAKNNDDQYAATARYKRGR